MRHRHVRISCIKANPQSGIVSLSSSPPYRQHVYRGSSSGSSYSGRSSDSGISNGDNSSSNGGSGECNNYSDNDGILTVVMTVIKILNN